MQNTRLNTLVDGALGELGRWLGNPWRRLSVLIISLLGGNFLATTISTVAGQQADLDVVVAAFLASLTELISWLVYRNNRRRSLDRDVRPRSFWLEILNGIKLGVIYGLFVEAFKLGS